MMKRVGLYYPYIHIRDEEWIKTAALYWPRLARIVSDDYPLDQCRLVKVWAPRYPHIHKRDTRQPVDIACAVEEISG